MSKSNIPRPAILDLPVPDGFTPSKWAEHLVATDPEVATYFWKLGEEQEHARQRAVWDRYEAGTCQPD